MHTKAPKTTNNNHDNLEQHDKTKTATHNSEQRSLLPGLSLTQENILQLQRTIGNSAVMQLLKYHLQQQPAGPPIQRVESEEDEIDMLPDHAIQMVGDLEDEEEIQMKQDNIAIQRAEIEDEDEIQMKHEHTIENNTGMSDNLKAGLETLSGLDLSDVRVHHNSDKPSQVGALGYTQGANIYIAPGQEQHLPHEGWHVVQQKQKRVNPTIQKAHININDDIGLENEANVMGNRAVIIASQMKAGKLAKGSHNQITRVKSNKPENKYSSINDKITTIQLLKIEEGSTPIKTGEIKYKRTAYTLSDSVKFLRIPGATLGMEIMFTPNENCKDTDAIRMVQIVKQIEHQYGEDKPFYEIKDKEASSAIIKRLVTKNTENDSNKKVQPGFFVDANYDADELNTSTDIFNDKKSLIPEFGSFIGKRRTNRKDPIVNPYYDATGPVFKESKESETYEKHYKEFKESQETPFFDTEKESVHVSENVIGMKKGNDIVPAIMVDTPSDNMECDYDFYTGIHDQTNNCYLGYIKWGFKIRSNNINLEKEPLDAYFEVLSDNDATLAANTIEEAIVNFNEYFGNEGAYSSPEIFYFVTEMEIDTAIKKYKKHKETFDIIEVLYAWAEDKEIDLLELLEKKILELENTSSGDDNQYNESKYREGMLGESLVGGSKQVDNNPAKDSRDDWPNIIKIWQEKEKELFYMVLPEKKVSFKKPKRPGKRK